MKKNVTFLLFCILFLCCFAQAFADNLDLSSMSLDELADLQNRIRTEIDGRIGPANNSIIYPGTYYVGKDIIAGKYLFTVTKENKGASDGMTIAIYDDDEIYQENKGKSPYWGLNDNAKRFYGMDQDETMVISLEEGEILIISWGEATVSPYIKPSWAP